ncbi:MAG: hypothetical protein AB7O97_18180 [Planctomycetota bacterium]
MRIAVALVLLLAAAPMPAQDDARPADPPAGAGTVDLGALGALDVLAVERRQDLRGRDALARVLRAARSDWRFEDLAPRDVCRLFAARLGDKVNFMAPRPRAAAGDGGAATPTASLDLRAQSLWTAMAVVELQTGLQFVYRSGVVFLVPGDEVKPLHYVRVYDLRPQTTPLRNFPGPELRLPDGENSGVLWPEEEEPTTTVSGFTAEGIEGLLREHVRPESWDNGASLTNNNGLFVVRQTPDGHRQVEALLIELGLWERPRVLVRRPAPPARSPARSTSVAEAGRRDRSCAVAGRVGSHADTPGPRPASVPSPIDRCSAATNGVGQVCRTCGA